MMMKRLAVILMFLVLIACDQRHTPDMCTDAGELPTDAAPGLPDAARPAVAPPWDGIYGIAWSCGGAACEWTPVLSIFDRMTLANGAMVFWNTQPLAFPVPAPVILDATGECATLRLMVDHIYQAVICYDMGVIDGYVVHNQDPSLVWYITASPIPTAVLSQ